MKECRSSKVKLQNTTNETYNLSMGSYKKFFALVCLGVSFACVTTPISNKSAFIIIPLRQEISLGEQAYDQILKNEKVAILFSEKDEIEIIDLDEAKNITINVQEDKFDFKIYSNDGSETEELLSGKTLRIKYPEGLLDDNDIDIKLVVIN